MKEKKYFKTIGGKRIPLPVFFPDATRAVLKTLDSSDIEGTKTPGVLVNTFHLYNSLGRKIFKRFGGVRNFMSFYGGTISDSGGFQVMSLAKAGGGRNTVSDQGVTFKLQGKKKILFTPEESVRFQMVLKPDMVVVLDDFTDPRDNHQKAEETVRRTIIWAKKSKEEFEKQCKRLGLSKKDRPYLLAVVQGGEYLDLRKQCAQSLAKIGFDGFGYGGWPLDKNGNFNYEVAKCIAKHTPKGYFLYGLGIGKPDEVVGCVDLGYNIFDCVLPTRDARHRRLYVYEADSIEEIDVRAPKFYSYYTPDKEKYFQDQRPVSKACDCLLCKKYSRAYLAHLFRIKEASARRLATIHNLRFYSILMEKIRGK